MAAVAVLGAHGLIGGLITTELAANHTVVALGANVPTNRAPTSQPAINTQVVTNTESVIQAARGCDMLINASSSPEHDIHAITSALAAMGTHVIDTSADAASSAALYLDASLARSSATVVPGAGLQHLVGDLLAHVGAQSMRQAGGQANEVHIAYVTPDDPMFRNASRGRRRSWLMTLGAGAPALQYGEVTEQPLGAWRRLAWFPRPIGPSHAAEIGGGEVYSVPRHVPDAQVVRTYLVVGGWRAELLTTMANAMRWTPTQRLLQRRLGRRTTPPRTARHPQRWAAVAEVAAASVDDPDRPQTQALGARPGALVRAWAYGRDPYQLTAVAAVVAAEQVLRAGMTGVCAPSELGEAAVLLDELAARTDLRWSVT